METKTTDSKEILQRLMKIQKDLDYLKERVDEDGVLSAEEERLLHESYKDEKEGKLLSSDQLRRKLRL